MSGICWVNGEICLSAQASISVMDHGFLYGDGVFEGIRFYHHTPFLLAEHLERLAFSAQAIALALPWKQHDFEKIIMRLIERSGLESGYIRLIVTRGQGALGISPESCKRPSLVVIVDELSIASERMRQQGVKVVTVATRKAAMDVLDARVKSLNYLNAIMAKIEANLAQADEAILLNAQGYVAEGSVENIFVIRDDQLLTPPTTDGALAGMTRGLMIQLAKAAGITVHEVSLTRYDLYTAQGAFLTGTGAELIPIREIDGRSIGWGHPFIGFLSGAFRRKIDEQCKVA